MAFTDPQVREEQPRLPLLSRLGIGSQAYGTVAVVGSINWLRGWNEYFFPSESRPDAIKTYETRRHLPISIFIPANYPKSGTGNPSLPTLFTIHGGGFTIGMPSDDDKWNRTVADTHSILVIALNYSKAPLHPFPYAIHDLEALIIAILADISLPINKQKCAIAGFSAGGNLTMAVSQLDSLRSAFQSYNSPGFKAAIPVYPGLDRTVSRDVKATQRQYKADLSPRRNSKTDGLLLPGKFFDWSYIPVGQDLRDPLLSPIFAPRNKLPPWVFLIACELDMNSHEAWRMACRLAGKEIPAMDVKTGRVECGETGLLELVDERFAWEVKDEKKEGIRWLLVPDVVHAFDRLPPSWLGDSTSVRDAEEKTRKVIAEIGGWLSQAWAD